MCILNIIKQFTDMKSIANIKTRKKEALISHMRNDDGKIEASRKGSIANTFSNFYGELKKKTPTMERIPAKKK